MTVISIKEYAKERGISYEAVRRQVKNYKNELDGLLVRDGRQHFLSEKAVAFLDDHRAKTPFAVLDEEASRKIKELKEKLEKKQEKVDELNDTVREALLRINALTEEKHQLEGRIARVAQLEASEEERKQELDELKQEATEAVQRANAADRELVAERNAREAAEKVAQTERDVREATEQELETLKAEVERLRARKWYDVLFKKGK